MSTEDIEAELGRIAGSSCQPIIVISTQNIITQIVQELGEEALSMNVSDLLNIQDEVKAILDHELDIRDYIRPAIETWRITKQP
jgi:hypothetical protein